MKSSKYKGVTKLRKHSTNHAKLWRAHCILENGKYWQANHLTEREAAVAYDIKMIELGKQPVNILTKV